MSLPTKVDLHSHSLCSDGALSPSDLVAQASAQGVTMLALTDHDTVAGLAEAQAAAETHALQLIPGVEISCMWQHFEIHVLGLGMNPVQPVLQEGLRHNQARRQHRVMRMADKLEACGITGVNDYLANLPEQGVFGRGHLARFLLETQVVKTWADAFKKYLGTGRRAYVEPGWATLDEVLSWIKQSGGQAVLAHPIAYDMNWQKRLLLFDYFKRQGGDALEIASGRQCNPDQVRTMARHCRLFKLAASMGSDFHGPHLGGVLGRLPSLPEGLTPVWQAWS